MHRPHGRVRTVQHEHGPVSEGLHAAIVESRLQHPGRPDVDRHVANAVALSTPRGWRLEQGPGTICVDRRVARPGVRGSRSAAIPKQASERQHELQTWRAVDDASTGRHESGLLKHPP
jgi:hypothetical protein